MGFVIQTKNILKEGEIQYSYLLLTVYYDLSRNSATSELQFIEYNRIQLMYIHITEIDCYIATSTFSLNQIENKTGHEPVVTSLYNVSTRKCECAIIIVGSISLSRVAKTHIQLSLDSYFQI